MLDDIKKAFRRTRPSPMAVVVLAMVVGAVAAAIIKDAVVAMASAPMALAHRLAKYNR